MSAKMPNRQHFMDRLVGAINDRDSRVALGLDSDPRRIPECFKKGGKTARALADAQMAFNRLLLDALSPIVAAVKVQIAFYEMLGSDGLRSYANTVKCAHDHGLLVIGDIKRGDIGSTAEAYALAHISGGESVDAITVSPYLGYDSIEPFLRIGADRGVGIFVLVRTSNRSASDLQDLVVDEEGGSKPVFMVLASQLHNWGAATIGSSGFSRLGAVVGATYPQDALRLRQLLPNTFFLVPGYGAQGATASDVAVCFKEGCGGAIINSSRGIVFAHEKSGGTTVTEAVIVDAARNAASRMRREINEALR